MKATQLHHNLEQSIWLDNITRGLLDKRTLEHSIDGLSLTGPASNPTILGHAIKSRTAYARVAVEQASPFPWERHTGVEGSIIGMKPFGTSAPQRKFAFEPKLMVKAAQQWLGR